MDYYDKTLLVLNQVKKEDDDMIAFFIFGSFVTKETSPKTYKEIRVFDGSNFLFSKFNLINLYPDIDILCVSGDVKKTTSIFDRKIIGVSGHYVTINVVSKNIFEKELFSDRPTAIKRIMLYRQLLIIKGEEYLNTLRQDVLKIETPLDVAFQQEFDFKKEYLRLFSKYNVPTVTITKDDYDRLFPNLLKFITGNLDGGFPKDRSKLVYPSPMGLKAEINLSDVKVKDII